MVFVFGFIGVKMIVEYVGVEVLIEVLFVVVVIMFGGGVGVSFMLLFEDKEGEE